MKLTTAQRKAVEATIARIRATGASVTGSPRLLIVRHRGATWEVWPRTGKYRQRVFGVSRTLTSYHGIQGLLAALQSDLAEHQLRSYESEGRVPIAAQG